MSIFETLLQATPRYPAPNPGMAAYSIFGIIAPVSALIITVGVFYVLIKLGQFLDAMKEKAEAGPAKK